MSDLISNGIIQNEIAVSSLLAQLAKMKSNEHTLCGKWVFSGVARDGED